MKTLLYIDCNIRLQQSRTKQLAETFLSSISSEYEIINLNLMKENLKPLYGDYFFEREKLLERNELNHPRFDYSHQIAEADVVVMAAPFWDLSFPSLLKIYIENCSVDGITFYSDNSGLHGLCKGRLIYLTTRGGNYHENFWAQDITYLKAIQEFFGFSQFDYIAADEMDINAVTASISLENAKEKAVLLAKSL